MSNDSTIVRQLQHIELDMLISFADVCDKLHLKYFLLGGSVIGAIRHKGFIPWDDDIDVGLLRKDYEIFLREAQKYFPQKYFVQTNYTDGGYFRNYAKLRNSDTTFIERGNKKGNFNQGVFIDIFPLDYYPDKKISAVLLNIRKDIYMAKISESFDEESINDSLLKRIIRKLIQRCIPSIQKALKKRENLFKSVKSSHFVINYEGAYGLREIVPLEWFGDGCFVEFEKRMFRVPKEYDKYLTHIYGDYMELPPKEKQISNHDTVLIDISKSYLSYMD